MIRLTLIRNLLAGEIRALTPPKTAQAFTVVSRFAFLSYTARFLFGSGLVGLLMVFVLSCPWVAAAEETRSATEDRQVETRLKQLSMELRCLVCQNQSLADSHAPLAEDLRAEIRKMMDEGLSDEEIVDFLVSRYGDFVRYRPPVKATTWFLWFGPFLFLASGAAVLGIALRRRQRQLADAPLSEEEHTRADRLLSEEKEIP